MCNEQISWKSDIVDSLDGWMDRQMSSHKVFFFFLQNAQSDILFVY